MLLGKPKLLNQVKCIKIKYVQLKDGCKLGYADLGDPKSTPIFHFHGYPDSRLEATLVIDLIKDKGVRFIGVDRPGMSRSDFKKGRTILDWPDDVIEILFLSFQSLRVIIINLKYE